MQAVDRQVHDTGRDQRTTAKASFEASLDLCEQQTAVLLEATPKGISRHCESEAPHLHLASSV